MKLVSVTIWWNDVVTHSYHVGQAQLKILDNRSSENWQFKYLTNSNGACCGGWEDMGDERCAASLLAMAMDAIITDGVPPEEVERELMQIDEYRDYRENFEGPFAAVYRGDKVKSR